MYKKLKARIFQNTYFIFINMLTGMLACPHFKIHITYPAGIYAASSLGGIELWAAQDC